MLVKRRTHRLTFGWLLSIFLFHCIQENASNPNLLLAVVEQQLQPISSVAVPTLKACLVTNQIASGKVTTCYETTASSCNLNFFNNIATPTILQNRRDDLTFININFANCTTGATPLFVKYSNLVPPTSVLFKDQLGLNGANLESQFQFTNQNSCKELGLESSGFVPGNFSRVLNSEELYQLNSLEAELALIPATTNNCFTDLNFNQSLINLAQNIKNGSYQRGITCAYQSGSGFPICPWSL
ncbi:LA_1694 family PerA/PerB upregulated protein [Leptospira adleri]|uniref:LA_1694 family PerA/PerB upregulated protein n=1 Tax=Leptospira adleri TaxID=2023186 RepID=UPI00108445E7|nr:hypothetical protein [Leptospira adleri]TGM58683.1 hypothetical protein EHQ97_06225 [Leptospira adleri]